MASGDTGVMKVQNFTKTFGGSYNSGGMQAYCWDCDYKGPTRQLRKESNKDLREHKETYRHKNGGGRGWF